MYDKTYNYQIIATDSSGRKTDWRVSGFETPEKAQLACIKFARDTGWSFPKWWQFWRWADTKPNLYSIKDLNT